MKRRQQPAIGGYSEYHKYSIPDVETDLSTIDTAKEQLLLDDLMEQGFFWEEAARLLHMREHLYENGEIRQRMTDDSRLQFARWLYHSGEMSEK